MTTDSRPRARALRLDRPLQRLPAAVARALLGVGIVSAPAVDAQPAADEQPAQSDRLEEIIVRESPGERYRTDASTLSKLTENLRDTPQSITTLSRELLDDRGATSLNAALRNVPGITLGAGEFSWQGNNPNIRGFAARDDMYLDGLRDFGSYPRDPFDLESIEVLLGPSSVLFGRGSTGGAINQVTKEASLRELTELSLDVGSDNTVRGTADLSRTVPLLGDGAAFRLNALAHRGEVSDRELARIERFGLAPTLALGLGSPTQVSLSYLRQSSDDRPDYGLPWLGGAPADVPRGNFYGFSSDYLETHADIATARVRHAGGERVEIESLARYARYSRKSRITEPLITQPVPEDVDLADVAVFRYVFIGNSDETLLTSQTNVAVELGSGTVEHAIVTGVELSRETSEPTFAFGIGAPETNLLRPTPSDPFRATTTEPRIVADTTGDTIAIYALDTIHIGAAWQLTAGVRHDRFETDYEAMRFSGPATPFNQGDESGPESFHRVDEVTSYRAALVYKPNPETSIYVAGGTSFNPSGQSLSFLTSGRGLGVGNVLLEPEKNRSLEIGLKADLLEGALSLAAAAFQIEKTNARVPDPTRPGFNVLAGEHRMRGFSVSLDGMPTDRFYVSTGYAYLDGEVVRGPPGAAAGGPLANAPEHSLSFWTDILVTDRFDLGLGARYVDDQYATNGSATKAVPGYSVFDAMARYSVSDTLTVKLNLANLTDELYFDQLHPWHVIPGPGFTATLAVNVRL